jgi:antitoxin component YwqK of YwqJK toxin-antitoxin module|tara:strand:+ start:1103 stop:1636 length:534 start_codon:yes stop_codon:yes gene_type:complete
MISKNIILNFIVILLFPLAVEASDTLNQTLEKIDAKEVHKECIINFPNFHAVKELKEILEKKKKKLNFFPQTKPQFEILWHNNYSIKAIIEVDDQLTWNGSIHSWYTFGKYLGCAELYNGNHKGISIAYHINGNIRAFVDFKNGKPFGFEYQFYEDGSLKNSINHNLNQEQLLKFNH